MSVGEVTKDSGNFKPHQLTTTNYHLKTEQQARVGLSIVELTADGNIKASAGTLYNLVITGDGVTAGDKVQIKDGGSGGTVRLTIIFDATDQTFIIPLHAAAFATDIYSDETKTGGTIYVTAVYA